MPDLQSCYFCGTPENVQEYAVVPPRFLPDDESPQSAVLCEQCKTKLLEVVEPLTEQLEQSNRSPETAPSTTTSDESTQPTEPAESGITLSSPGDSGTDQAGADDTGTASVETDVTPESEESDAPGSAEPSTPPNYRRAMRMLSNREFPLPRSEVESMLGGAYDLERHEIASVLDHAIETGRLVEEDGQFHEP